MRKAISNLLSSILIIAFFGLILEMGSRILYEKITPLPGRKAVDILLGKSNMYQYSMFIPHAYMLYINRPLWNDGHFQQNNSLGYRGHEISINPDKKTTRILTLGGSTTYESTGIENPEESWTARLETLLRKQGIPVETVNGGLNGGTSAEILSQYIYKHRYIKPNIVILDVGWNDAMSLLFNHYDPSYGSYRSWGGSPINLRHGEKTLLNSYLVRVIYAWWLGNPTLSDLLLFPPEYNSMSPNEAQQNVNHNQPVGFARNIDLLVKNIISDGSKPVFFIEPVASSEIFKRSNQDRWIESIYPELLTAYEHDKSVIRKIAKKYHVLVIEMPTNSIPLKDFVDHAHINADGAKLKAAYIAEHLPASFIRSNA